MLEELKIEGFRSLKSVTWRPGKLNVLIGPNGGGKSNLLRTLDLLRVGASGSLRESIIQMGGMAPLVWDGAAERIKFDIVSTLSPFLLGLEFRYQFELQRLGGSGSYTVENEQLLGQKPPSSKFDHPELFSQAIESPSIKRSENSSSELAISRMKSGEVPEVLLFQLALLTVNVFDDFRVDRHAEIRRAAVAREEERVSGDGQNLVAVLHTHYSGNREFEAAIDDAMTAAFPGDYEKLVFTPAEDGRIQLRIRRKNRRRTDSSADLSDGTIRFLLLATILGLAKGSLIAIDEPETGLHPRMLPIIAELAGNAAMKTQVVFTTHSPQFLDAFRDEPPTITVVTSNGSETKLATIEGDELRRWIEDYSLGRFAFSGEAEAIS